MCSGTSSDLAAAPRKKPTGLWGCLDLGFLLSLHSSLADYHGQEDGGGRGMVPEERKKGWAKEAGKECK